MVVMTTRVRVRVRRTKRRGKRRQYAAPLGTDHVIGHRAAAGERQPAIGRRKTVDAQNFIIIIIIFFFHRPILTLWPYRTVYYTKTATANCESDYDSRSSAAVVATAAAATVENNIILLMNRNPIACRQSLCISCN